MQTELLAVVDEHDREVARLPRWQIHQQGLMHRAVHILVFNQRGQILLQKRSLKKDLNRGLWDTSAAGHVDAGEDYATTAPRELSEELGIASTLTYLFKLSPTPALGMEFIQVYSTVHDGPFQVAEDEIDELDWFSPADIDSRVAEQDPSLTKTFRLIWQGYRQHP